MGTKTENVEDLLVFSRLLSWTR